MFLGGLTIACGVLVWFILGTPREVRWLNEDEKKAAIARVVANQTGSDRNKRSEFKWEQVWSTFKGQLVLVVFKTWDILNDVKTDKGISTRPANVLLLLRYYHQRTAERSEYYIFEVDLEVIRLHTVGDTSKGVYSILLR